MASLFCFNHGHYSLCVALFLVLSLASQSCYGFGTFGFDMHHRYSDPVTKILGVDELPEKGTREYYVAMAHRDRIIRGRGLAGDDQTALTFANGNKTHRFSSLGFLHYANVSVGTPSLWFLVALDTGSDLFWLPCNCSSCVQGLKKSNGQRIDLNIYGNTSSTSKNVLCNSTLCEQQKQCPSSGSTCPYKVRYATEGTSSTGVLVEDVLHLITDDDQTKRIDARITFGCGEVQTGSFLTGLAPNGLFGLGMDNISVPSILANEGFTSNSFSMCFGTDGVGRIRFGDKGSSDQAKTPFIPSASHPTYNISITQIIVGGNAADLEFYAIFDSGTSITILNDPAYTQITESFNTLVKEKRHSSNNSDDLPFEYCYELSPNQTSFEVPILNFTMRGGHNYFVTDCTVEIHFEDGRNVFCLGIFKSNDVNIIGQNFMTGYRVIFDRDNMILGWKESNCYDDELTKPLPLSPSRSPAVSPSPAISPAIAFPPEATSNQLGTSSALPPSGSSKTNSFTFAFMIVLLPLLAIV